MVMVMVMVMVGVSIENISHQALDFSHLSWTSLPSSLLPQSLLQVSPPSKSLSPILSSLPSPVSPSPVSPINNFSLRQLKLDGLPLTCDCSLLWLWEVIFTISSSMVSPNHNPYNPCNPDLTKHRHHGCPHPGPAA